MSEVEVEADLATLCRADARAFDPVRMHFIEVLARRAAGQPESVKRLLDLKVQQAVADLQARLVDSLQKKEQTIEQPRGQEGNLAALSANLRQQARRYVTEQDSVAYFRDNWSRLNTNKQVTKAIDQAPKNAGPINSHGLVLKSLALMRDVSPDYLNRFVTYMDALLILDQDDGSKPVRALVKRPAKTRKP
jgi:hypothetical protein